MPASSGSLYLSVSSQLLAGSSPEQVLRSLAQQLEQSRPQACVSIWIWKDGALGERLVHGGADAAALFVGLRASGLDDVAGPAAIDEAQPERALCLDEVVSAPSALLAGEISRLGVQAVYAAPISLSQGARVGVVLISDAGSKRPAAEASCVAETGARLASFVLRADAPGRALSGERREAESTRSERVRAADERTTKSAQMKSAQMKLVAGRSQQLPARVLVVEDDPAVGDVMRRSLTVEGYEVELVPDPFRGLELIRSSPADYELLLVDYTMPGIDGLELAARVRSGGVEVPIVMISGLGEDRLRAASGAEAVDAFVSKPFTPQGLRDAIGDARCRRSAS
ncbi:MAG: hypothetical protein CMJ88_07685 [Planctomycetes bacterium]|nr:hypothetical protein [Planctomycetota bacterium]